jgi:LacI family transcriptional regulator
MTIAGFSNFDMPGILHNNVITVKQPAFEMGKLATELLLELIDKKNKSAQKYFDKIVLPTNLISNHSMRKNN